MTSHNSSLRLELHFLTGKGLSGGHVINAGNRVIEPAYDDAPLSHILAPRIDPSRLPLDRFGSAACLSSVITQPRPVSPIGFRITLCHHCRSWPGPSFVEGQGQLPHGLVR